MQSKRIGILPEFVPWGAPKGEVHRGGTAASPGYRPVERNTPKTEQLLRRSPVPGSVRGEPGTNSRTQKNTLTMIGKGKSISHGVAALEYDLAKEINGQAVATEIARHELYGCTGAEMVQEMKPYHIDFPNVKNNCLRFEVSPSIEESTTFTDADWAELGNDFMQRMGLANHQYIIIRHSGTESKKEQAHLHILANRVSLSGELYRDNWIGKKATEAANAIAKERNFVQSQDIGKVNKAEINSNLIVVINDNEMSIPENHGALGRHLKQLKESAGKQKDNFFKALGFEYHLIENGNDLESVIKELESVKDTKVPVVVHVCTQKGKGYKPAEENSENWHWARPFDKETGKNKNAGIGENYGNIVGEHLLNRIQNDPEVAVIAASTPICIGFDKTRRELAGKQYIDVGIAEQNAVTMAVGMAKRGCKPVFATNGTFIQRAYDQIEQEMCINQIPATMIVTHASVFGHHNDTHIGILDIPLLANIPNLTYLAPVNKEEYLAMLDWSIDQKEKPVAITAIPHTAQSMITLSNS